jgi:hypothetical protein
MRVFLMHHDRDFELHNGLASNAAELAQDLALDTLFEAMAAGDPFLLEVAKSSVLASLVEREAIDYRQSVLRDCMAQPAVVRELYGITVEAIEKEKRVWGWMSARYPEGTLHRASDVLRIFIERFHKIRHLVDEQGSEFRSQGFKRLFDMLRAELSDEYLGAVEAHLGRLEFPSGIYMSAGLGDGCKGADYILLKTPEVKQGWLERIQSWAGSVKGNGMEFVYEVDSRDEAGLRALSNLRVEGIGRIAAAVAQSTDHILSFFRVLRLELGFYIGCLNLRDRLAHKQEPFCFPELLAMTRPMLECRSLYDVCLSLTIGERTVGNDISGADKALAVITGANRGGKSTFLRSVGLAQLMMQCGMFVPAQSFRANLCEGIFTHFKREEDTGMKSGKLDEELARMSAIIDRITPHSVVLFNESFASTNEREGSQIARQIVSALLEMGIKVFYVTHLFDLADGLYRARMESALFLRAERLSDGQRTFRLLAGEPLPTSFGEDLYERIFDEPQAAAATNSQS